MHTLLRDRALLIDQHHTFPVEVCRSLARQGVEVHVFARPASPAFASRYCARRIVSPPWELTDRFLDAVRQAVTRHAYDAILICDEELLEVMAPIIDGSEAWQGLLLPAPADLRRTFSKNAVLEAVRAAGVPVPPTVIPASDEEVPAVVRELRLPVVVKGEKGGGAYNVRIAHTLDQARAAYREVAERERGYGGRTALQAFVAGGTYLFGGLFQDGQALRICAHHKALMYPPGQGTTARAVTERPAALVEYGRRVMEALRYTGLGDLDFIRDQRDGQFKFLEINPRLWASIGLAECAGVDFYGPYLRLARGLPVEPDLRYREGVVFHLIAKELQLIKRTPARLFGFVRDCLDPRVGSDLDWRDLGPMRALLAQALRPQPDVHPESMPEAARGV